MCKLENGMFENKIMRSRVISKAAMYVCMSIDCNCTITKAYFEHKE